MNSIKQRPIIPSAAFTIPVKKIKKYARLKKKPEVGDLIYCQVEYVGHHKTLESRAARRHTINDGTKAVMVIGNRYAPDYYEAVAPKKLERCLDMVVSGGIVGKVKCRNSLVGDPTRVKVLGYVCDDNGTILNTKNFLNEV